MKKLFTLRRIAFLLVIPLSFFSPKKAKAQNKKVTLKEVTLSDIYEKKTFSQKSVYGINWMNDGAFYSSQKDNDIVKFDVKGNEITKILEGATLSPNIQFSSYSFSADEQKILLTTERKAIYRRSYTAEFYIYDIASKKLQKLSSKGKQSYATFSPDGTKVAFVRTNNVFYTELDGMEEHQITHDGKFNSIINGSADWVYEEEFSFIKAFFWSPDSEKIAYYIFDETNVKEYNLQFWNTDSSYPKDYRYKYPKVGEENSKVKIGIYHIAGRSIQADLQGDFEYIPRIKWTKNAQLLSVRKMNRLQNTVTLLHINADSGDAKVILKEKSDTYIDLEYCDDLTYLNDGLHFIHSSEKSGYKHLYLYTMKGELIRQITNGNWEVVNFLGIDEKSKKKQLYFVSTESSPLERDFYTIDLEGKKKVKLSEGKGTHRINISNDFKYYLDYFSNNTTPQKVTLFKTKKNALVKVLEDNSKLKETVKEFKMATKEMFTFKTSEGTSLNGYMLKPADFDEKKKYPVLMFLYGGPGSQMVANSWGSRNHYWHQILTQKGYIIACVDNRGTGYRGEKFKKITYAQLGKLEVEDQIETAKYLGGLNYVNKDRIGIWGWSYGGYMSSLCVMIGNEYFKTAIAVAPVSTWRFYDTIYTERFLKTPQENASGYDDNSPLAHVDKLKGNYLLVHGTGDDNVHFQNATILQNALIKANKQFSSFYYPDRNHGIYGGNTRMHLFEMLTNFIEEKL